MAPTTELYCPDCDGETTHRLVARTRLHIGTKRKWRCDACEYLVVTINDAVLSASS